MTGKFDQLGQRLRDNNLAMLEASPDDGNTALHHLMRYNPETSTTQEEILEIYFETSSKCNPRNTRGDTPLHTAIYENNIGVVRFLIRNGADLEAQEGSGKTPLDLAKALERSAITTLIRQALDQDVDLQVSSEVEESQPQPLTTKEYPTQQFVSDDYPADVYLGKHAEES